MAFSVSYIYELVDRYSNKIKKITAGTKKFQKQIKKASQSVRKFGDRTQAVGRNMSSFWASAAAGAALLVPTKAAMDFESSMADVKKAVNDIKTPAQLKEMKGVIYGTSKQLGIMPGQIADLAAEAGKMGIPLQDMKIFLKLAGSAAVAFDMSGKEAGEVIGKIKTQYKLSLEGTRTLLDAVNYLADNTNAKASDVLEILTRMQGKFNALKFPTQIAAGWSAAAARLSVSPQIAASGLDMMITSIQKKLPKLTKAMDVDPSGALMAHFKKLSKLPVDKMRKEIAAIYGTGAGADLALSYATNLNVLASTLSLTSDKAKFAGSMQKELDIKLGTTSRKLKQMTAGLKIAAIGIGESLLPMIKRLTDFIVPIIDKMVIWIKNNQEITKWIMIIVGVLAILGPAIIALGFTISAIGTIASVVGAIFGVVFSPFILIIAGIAAAIVGLILLFKNWGTVMNWLGGLWNNIWTGIVSGWNSVKTEFITGINKIKSDFIEVGNFIMGFLTPIIDKIQGFFSTVANTKVGKYLIDKLAGPVDTVMNTGIYDETGVGSPASIKPQAVNLNGQINVGVSGGIVESSSLETDTGGNLGFNNPMGH